MNETLHQHHDNDVLVCKDGLVSGCVKKHVVGGGRYVRVTLPDGHKDYPCQALYLKRDEVLHSALAINVGDEFDVSCLTPLIEPFASCADPRPKWAEVAEE